ncbi:MAG: Gfo/Idh/MocA family protein [Phycisphaerales bacterium]
MNGTLKVAIVGTGFLARTRIRCWRRVHGVGIELVVAARDAAKAAAFAKEQGIAASGSIEEVLADRSVALADLCVANRAHRALCEQSAAHGKQVLCTKPLAAYCGQDLPESASAEEVASIDREAMFARAVEDADAMVDSCARAGVRLFYGENWVFAPSIGQAASMAERSRGAILELRGWESHSGSHSPYSKDWRHTGGGALLRLGAHPIGAMLWLKRREGERLRGRPTRAISASAEVADTTVAATESCAVATGWRGVENFGVCTIAFDDGSRGVAFGSDAMLGGMQSHLTILASDHRFECALSPQQSLRAFAPNESVFGDAYVMEKSGPAVGWSTPMPDEDLASGQQGLVQAVADDLRLDREPRCDGSLGAEVVRVVYAAYRSAAAGRRIEW